ncbi:MAG: twin-arginine translocation signal domain-containing protein [Phycisphaerae bacterium]
MEANATESKQLTRRRVLQAAAGAGAALVMAALPGRRSPAICPTASPLLCGSTRQRANFGRVGLGCSKPKCKYPLMFLKPGGVNQRVFDRREDTSS